MDWFLYDNGVRHERVNENFVFGTFPEVYLEPSRTATMEPYFENS